jgi:hypothetical protein
MPTDCATTAGMQKDRIGDELFQLGFCSNIFITQKKCPSTRRMRKFTLKMYASNKNRLKIFRPDQHKVLESVINARSHW